MPTAAKRPKASPPPPPPPPTEEREPQEDIPEPSQRQRTAKFRRIQQAVEGIYIMLGGSVTTLPMVSPRAKQIGISLARSAEEIAEAWVDLAEEDKRVLAILEQFISFSGWGKVIGVHFMAIGVPGIMGAQQAPPQARRQQGPQPQQPTGGMSDVEQAMALASLFQQAASEARVQEPQPQQPGNGQPLTDEQIREQVARGQVRRAQPQGFRSRAGMPSPADMGVSTPDVPEQFPASGSESVKGG